MLCSTGIVNEIIVDTVCKIVMFPLKRPRRSHPGKELTRLVKRRLIREGALGLLETQPSRAGTSCLGETNMAPVSVCLLSSCPVSLAVHLCRPRAGGPEWLTCDLFHTDRRWETGLHFIMTHVFLAGEMPSFTWIPQQYFFPELSLRCGLIWHH